MLVPVPPWASVTVVPDCSIVPLVAGKVSVVVPATAGAEMVTAPLVSPEITTDDISNPFYWTTQREPLERVTTAPPDSVIGPADIAEKPAAIV